MYTYPVLIMDLFYPGSKNGRYNAKKQLCKFDYKFYVELKNIFSAPYLILVQDTTATSSTTCL